MTFIPDKIHEELINWSRWCWQGEWPHPLPATACGSAEGDYRSPPEYDDEVANAPEPPRITPNARHARIVQRTWETLPSLPRRVLKAEYPGRETAGRNESKYVAAVRLGLSLSDYDNWLAYAVRQVEKEFVA